MQALGFDMDYYDEFFEIEPKPFPTMCFME